MKDNGEEYIPDIELPAVYLAALKILEGTTEESPMSTSDLTVAVSREIEEEIKPYLIYRNLNQAAQDSASKLRSKKGRSGGYFLSKALELLEDDAPTKSEKNKEKTQEKHIWPLVSLWLSEFKQIPNSSHGIANLKKGGTWSNPDVVGLLPIEELGFFDVEVTTVEVKPSLSQWRYYFFEAVSHKRFSERVYFVFRSASSSSAEVNELKRYAEKYRVGLVEIELSDEKYGNLSGWSKISEEERISMLDAFVEHAPAPFEPISISEKVDFMKQIGIKSKADLYNFGTKEV